MKALQQIMTYKMFLDDERQPVDEDDWVIVRSFAAATDYVIRNGYPDFVSFDHDLGDGPNGHKFALWMIERDLDVGDMPENFDYYVHSQNPVGASNIRSVMDAYLDFKDKVRKK